MRGNSPRDHQSCSAPPGNARYDRERLRWLLISPVMSRAGFYFQEPKAACVLLGESVTSTSITQPATRSAREKKKKRRVAKLMHAGRHINVFAVTTVIFVRGEGRPRRVCVCVCVCDA